MHHKLHDYNQNRGADSDDIHPGTHCQTHASGGPHSGRRGQAVHQVVAHKNHARAQKSHSADHLCGDTGGVRLVSVKKTVLGNHHHQSSTQRHNGVGAYPCRLIPVFTFISNQKAQKGRDQYPEQVFHLRPDIGDLKLIPNR